jgi:GNAT superfamily N-acetyltransferase
VPRRRSSYTLAEKMLRPARIEDAETIATIHVRAWQAAYEGIVPTEFLASLSVPERTNLWRRVISEERGTVLMAVTPYGEAGFVSFGPSRDKDGNGKAEIYAIYVLPEFWHQGVGGDLLGEAERWTEDAHLAGLTLWVLEKNVLARRFYEARDFRLDRSHKEKPIGGLLLRELRYEKRWLDLNRKVHRQFCRFNLQGYHGGATLSQMAGIYRFLQNPV